MKTGFLDETRKIEAAGHACPQEVFSLNGEKAGGGVWHRFAETRDPRDREGLILENAWLVRNCADSMRRRVPPSIEYADLVAYGLLGLIDAVDRFDPTLDRDFTAYARKRIAGSIVDGIRREAGIPRAVYAKWKRMSRAEEELTRRLQREPRREEMAAYLGMDEEEYGRMLGEVHSWWTVSLDETMNWGDGGGSGSLLDSLVDDRALEPSSLVEDGSRDAEVRRSVRELPWRHRLVLELYYFQDFSMKEIAEVISVSESRASQLHNQALSRLKNRMNGGADLLSA